MKRFSIFYLMLLLLTSSCSKDDGGGNEDLRISIENLSIEEGDGDTDVFVRIRISEASNQNVTALVSTANGTAEAGDDYIALENEAIVFGDGVTSQEIKIVIKGDEEKEEDEEFTLTIVQADGAAITVATATITILNDDISIGGGGGGTFTDEGYITPETYPGLSLIWQDEFSGSAVDGSNWTFEIGNGNWGWGNNELEYYRAENTFLQDGYLVIEAREESFGGYNYTSSRMKTQNKFDFKYGRVDIRAILPEGQGVWPALWMLGDNITTASWPGCGEIDVMEILGHEPNKLYGTAHWSDAGNNHASFGGNKTLETGTFVDEFHVFSIIWDDTSIRWYLDDVNYHTLSITDAALSEFHNNQFFIFNVAVGGNWPGSPDASTVFPQQMIVDYIRVFQ